MARKEYQDASREKIAIVLILALLATILVVSITVGAVIAFLDKIETETKLREAMGEWKKICIVYFLNHVIYIWQNKMNK